MHGCMYVLGECVTLSTMEIPLLFLSCSVNNSGLESHCCTAAIMKMKLRVRIHSTIHLHSTTPASSVGSADSTTLKHSCNVQSHYTRERISTYRYTNNYGCTQTEERVALYSVVLVN